MPSGTRSRGTQRSATISARNRTWTTAADLTGLATSRWQRASVSAPLLIDSIQLYFSEWIGSLLDRAGGIYEPEGRA